MKKQDIKIFEQRADYKQVTCLRADFDIEIDLLYAEMVFQQKKMLSENDDEGFDYQQLDQNLEVYF